jgi:hypothetical protein
MNHALFGVAIFAGMALTSSAIAEDIDVKIGVGIPLAFGQTSTPLATRL